MVRGLAKAGFVFGVALMLLGFIIDANESQGCRVGLLLVPPGFILTLVFYFVVGNASDPPDEWRRIEVSIEEPSSPEEP